MLKRVLGVAVAVGLVGCGPDPRSKIETIEVKPQLASKQARDLLERYASGQPMGSEASTFPKLLADVRQEDPHLATTLEEGLKELQKPKADVKAKAKQLLTKIAPQARPPL